MGTQETTKIYRIEVPGIEAAIGKIQQLNQELELSKQIKKEAQKVLTANPGDAAEIEKQSRIIAEQEVAYRKLSAEKRVAQKESDIIIKMSQKEAEAHLNASKATQYAAGSYNQLYASYKNLVDQFKSTPSTDAKFDQLKQQTIEAKKHVDDFNRSLTADGTLVGEYKTGILNAFKQLGLTDIIKQQKNEIQKQITDLARQNEQLAAQLHGTGKSGKDAFASIEEQLKKNIETQEKLKGQLNTINTSLSTTHTIGKQIKESIGEGFKEIIASGLAVAGVAIGIHEAFEFIKDSMKEFEESERVTAQLHNTLENLGKVEVFERLKTKAEELRKEFQYLNEGDILQVFNKLIDFGRLTEKQINQLLPVIINFAAKTNTSIQSASDTIIQALEGGHSASSALKQFGISLSQSSTFADRFRIIMDSLADKVKDSGKAFQESAEGGIAKFNEEIKESKEQIGGNLLPVWASFLSLINKCIAGLKYIPNLLSSIALSNDPLNFLIGKTSDADKRQASLDAANLAGPEDMAQVDFQKIKKAIEEKKITLKNVIETYEKEINDPSFDAKLKAIRKRTVDLLNVEFDPSTLGKPTTNLDELRRQHQLQIEEIEAEAVAEQVLLERKKLKGLVSEQQYQEQLFNILKSAGEKKLAVLTLNDAQEKSQRNQIRLQLIKDEQGFNDKMFQLAKDRIDGQKVLNDQLAKEAFDQVNNNPAATAIQKVNAQKTLDQQLLKNQQEYNEASLTNEVAYAKRSKKNEADRAKAISDIDINLQKDTLESFKVYFEQLLSANQYAEDFKQNIIESTLAVQKLSVLNDKSLTDSQRAMKLLNLESKAQLDINAIQVESTKKQILYYELAYGALAIYNKEFQKLLVQLNQLKVSEKELQAQRVAQQVAKVSAGSTDNTQNFLTDQLSKDLFGGDDPTNEKQQADKKLLGAIITSSFDTAHLAMDNYFNAEQARIEQSKQLAYDRIDLEAKIAKTRAQSQAEIEAIDQQAAAKKKAADKQALDETKKLKRAEAKIALATELANIAVAAAQNPLNGITLGTAGIIEYGVLAGLAVARYLLNVQSINQATSFGKGGSLKKLARGGFAHILGEGGEFEGQSHAMGGNRFLFGEMPVETEAKEAYIINKFATQSRGVYTVTGTPKQIASSINEIGGGRRFAPGASLYRRMAYGGSLGDSLRAPVNPSSFLNRSGSGDINDLKNMIAVTAAGLQSLAIQTNERIDNLKVHVVTKEIQSALNKQVKNESITTL